MSWAGGLLFGYGIEKVLGWGDGVLIAMGYSDERRVDGEFLDPINFHTENFQYPICLTRETGMGGQMCV